ncbi:MAG: tetratricopeptide repeat protein [Rhodocyclaceae bacterium]
MAAYDLEEQEQLASIKAWWEKWGNIITGVLVVCAVVVIGWRGWGMYQDSRAGDASVAYASLTDAIQKKDANAIKSISAKLESDYAGTAQADLGALLAAKAALDANDTAAAKVQLQFVVDKSKDALLRDTARLRLAALQADEKAYDLALKTLEATPEPAFLVRFLDLRGDIQVAKGALTDARATYQSAIDEINKSTEQSPLKPLVQSKLDALGGV